MGSDRVRSTTHAVRARIIWAAQELMRRAGCEVEEVSVSPTATTLRVSNPRDPADPHGERLKELLASRKGG